MDKGKSDLDVVVIGAGIVGLMTATALQSRFRHVRILSSLGITETTSAKAGAIWEPVYVGDNRAHGAWSRETWKAYNDRQGAFNHLSYVKQRMNVVTTIGANDDLPLWIRMAQAEDPKFLELANVDHDKTGYAFDSFTVNCTKSLIQLQRQFIEAGGVFEKGAVTREDIQDMSGLIKDADIVVNSSGQGSEALTGHKIETIKGHLIDFQPPDHTKLVGTLFENAGDLPGVLKGNDIASSCYWIPKEDGSSITFGGTSQTDVYDADVDLDVAHLIIDNMPNEVLFGLSELYGLDTESQSLIRSRLKEKIGGEAQVRAGLRPNSHEVQLESGLINPSPERAAFLISAGAGLGGAGWSSFKGPVQYAVVQAKGFATDFDF